MIASQIFPGVFTSATFSYLIIIRDVNDATTAIVSPRNIVTSLRIVRREFQQLVKEQSAHIIKFIDRSRQARHGGSSWKRVCEFATLSRAPRRFFSSPSPFCVHLCSTTLARRGVYQCNWHSSSSYRRENTRNKKRGNVTPIDVVGDEIT